MTINLPENKQQAIETIVEICCHLYYENDYAYVASQYKKGISIIESISKEDRIEFIRRNIKSADKLDEETLRQAAEASAIAIAEINKNIVKFSKYVQYYN